LKIKEAIKKGIRRVYDPKWAEKNCYMLIPEIINGRHGPWISLFSDETQEMLGVETPQIFLLSQLKHGLDSYCEEYTGVLSKYDKEKYNERVDH
jgi:hypothetical protein